MYGKSKRVEFHYYLEDFIAKKVHNIEGIGIGLFLSGEIV